ncbi:phage tail length tape measure family protein [Methylopila sp. 73B]|uniref:phage tail length tape measure family protein n=1 Tax=Methylopila sp. 73B TaxID=1120792 RepID=UPI00036D1D1B|nr:phage tail length tape measure family protein [Methylopila sp. 73B]
MVTTSEVREIDIRSKATGVAETIGLLNRLITAEEGVVIVNEKIERSDASVARGLNAVQGRYIEHHRLVQQVTRDTQLLAEARARGRVTDEQYTATLSGMQAKLMSVAQAQKEVARGWAGMTASSTGSYDAMQIVTRQAEARVASAKRAEALLRGLGTGPGAPAGGRRLRTDQAVNFGYQIGDSVGSLGAGASLGQVGFQQIPQIVGIAAETGMTAREIVSDLGSRAAAMLTPVRLLTGGVAALGIAAVMAYSDWLDQQKQLEASTAGVGRGVGMTARALNDLAVANASAGGVSNATAREIAGSYASTGKIGGGVLSDLIKVTRDYAITTGQEVPEASKELARAFADPAKGAAALNEKLGVLDATQKRAIDRMAATGDVEGAQRALYAAMVTGIDRAGDRLSWLARTWNATKTGLSDVWTGAFEGPSIERQITTIEGRIASRRSAISGLGRNVPSGGQDERDLASLRSRQTEAQEQARSQRARERSITAQDYLLGIDASSNSVRRLETELERLKNDMSAGVILGDNFKLAQEQARRLEGAIASLRGENGKLLSDLDRAKIGFGLQMEGITARTPEQRAGLASRQYLESTRGRTDIDPATRQFNASAAGDLIRAQAREEEKRYRESQAERIRQSVEAAALEAQSVGRSATENDRLRIVMEKTNAARQRAYDLTGDFNKVAPATLDLIQREAAMTVALTAARRQANTALELQNERADLFRDATASRIADMQRQAGVSPESEYGRWIEQTTRMTESLREMKDTGGEAFKGLASDLRNGVKPAEALANALGRMGEKAFDKSVENVWDGLWSNANGSMKDIGKAPLSTASMAVTAANVSIGGTGVAALTGPGNISRSPLASVANDNAGNPFAGLRAPSSDGRSAAASADGVDLAAAARAIKTIESGGNYGALGPATRTGDRAHGAYQVMGANVGPWTEKYVGQRMTADQFRASPSAQDAVFNGEFGRLSSRYGAEGASRAWFAGEGGMNRAGATDVVGTSVGGYGSRFGQLYNQAPPSADAAALTAQSQAMAETTASIRNLNQTAAQAAPALGNVAQTAGNAGGVFSDLAQGLGGMLGMALGGKKNGAVGGMVGMLLGKVVGAGMQEGGWLSSMLKFEDGGVMTSRGRLPIRAYSAGGVANSPQLAMFGEGSTPEAYVPVPSGRIPVEMRGAMPMTPPPAAARVNRFGDTNITIQGSADDRVLAELKRELDARDRAWAYQRDNAWRAA